MISEQIDEHDFINSGMDQYQETIRMEGLEIAKQMRAKNEKEKWQSIIAVFEENVDGLYDRRHSDKIFQITVTTNPIFKNVDADLFFKQLLKAKVSSIQMVDAIFDKRYGVNVKIEPEIEFVSVVRDRIQKYLVAHKEKTKRRWALQEFYNNLSEIPIPETLSN
jgi:hypothetical protein